MSWQLDTHLATTIAGLRRAKRFRDRRAAGYIHKANQLAGAQGCVDLCSNDYLGLVHRGGIKDPKPSPSGASASRLVCGNYPGFTDLEAELSSYVGAPAALVFTSGYAANLGSLSALLSPTSQVFSDRLNHASLIDGCRLARAKVSIYPHLDLDALEAQLEAADPGLPRFIVTESYFSMDGDSPDFERLFHLRERFGAALVVDEAHALGVFGPGGAGLCAEFGKRPDVLIGTFGKAVGAQGAFVAGSEDLVDLLWNKARSLVFSTGLSPWLVEGARAGLAFVKGANQERMALRALSERLRSQLAGSALEIVPGSYGPIVPVVVGSEENALNLSAKLRSAGYLVGAIRPPTVPEGSARLRITLRAGLSDSCIDHFAQTLLGLAEELGE